MEDYPRTSDELEKRFGTDKACRAYLFNLRWPEGFICPHCGCNKSWEMKNGFFWCAGCNRRTSVSSGTIFEGTHKPLSMWFRVIWLVCSQKYGASAKGLQRMLGIGSYKTAWMWLHKLRRAMVRPGRDRLSGIIEVDETYIGGEKQGGKRGRGAPGKSLVVIAVQKKGRKLGRIRLQRVPDASAISLEKAVTDAAEPGSEIITDGWNGYNQLKEIGYEHLVIRKDASVGDNLLPACNLITSLLKRWLDGTLQGAVSHEHLDYYLDEYTFRFNRRTSQYRGKLFYRLLQHAVVTEATIYDSIKKGVRGRKKTQHKI